MIKTVIQAVLITILTLSTTRLEVSEEKVSIEYSLKELAPELKPMDPELIEVIPDLKPIDSEITSAFGFRIHPTLHMRKLHTGIDFRADTGTPVYSTAPAIVKEVCNGLTADGRKSSYGKHIILQHGDYQTLYAHLSEIMVKEGDTIDVQIIGKSGNTGRSTAPHLHYEVLYKGKAINPLNVIK